MLIPLHDRAADVDRCVAEVASVLDASGLSWEAVLVDDGSLDRTWDLLTALRDRDPRIALVRLSPRAGEPAAVWVGLRHCRGAAVIPYDADLRCAPESLPDLALEVLAGHDAVTGVRVGGADEVEAGEAEPERIGPSGCERLFAGVFGVHLVGADTVMAYARELAHRLSELPPGGLVLPAAALRRATSPARVPVAVRGERTGKADDTYAGDARTAWFLDAWAHGRDLGGAPFLGAAAALGMTWAAVRAQARALAALAALVTGALLAIGLVDLIAAWRRARWRKLPHPRIVEILPARMEYPSGAQS